MILIAVWVGLKAARGLGIKWSDKCCFEYFLKSPTKEVSLSLLGGVFSNTRRFDFDEDILFHGFEKSG